MSIPNHNTMIIITFKKFMVCPKYCKDLKKMLKKGNDLLSLKEWKSNQIRKRKSDHEKN